MGENVVIGAVAFAAATLAIAIAVVLVATWLSKRPLICRFGIDYSNGLDCCKALAAVDCQSGLCRYHCNKRCKCAPVGDLNHRLGVISGGKGKG